jgi:hypothetical protein
MIFLQMRKRLSLLTIFIVLLLFFTSFFFLYGAKYLIGRANISQQSFSVDNSYLFVSPLRALANNQEKIRLTVYILNNQGLGVIGKSVFLSNDLALSVEVIQGVTDAFGKAIFDISSSKAGEYYLEVKVDGKLLPQKAHLTFY